MGGGRGRTSGSCRYRTPKVHAECSREAPGRESRTTMMRRQMGDIGAIANVCNTDLQEPADDSASAGRDEDFHAPTRRYHDISVSVALPLCSHPQIPTHHRVPARRHGRNPELPTQLRAPTAKNAQQSQDATLTRGSRHARRAATPSYGYICRLRCFSRRPRPSTSRTGSSAPPAAPAATGNTSPALAPLLHTHSVHCAYMPGDRGDGRTAPADGGDDAALVDFHYFGIGAPPHDAVEIGGVRRGHGGVQYHGVSESQ